MTIAVDLGRKATKQTKQNMFGTKFKLTVDLTVYIESDIDFGVYTLHHSHK